MGAYRPYVLERLRGGGWPPVDEAVLAEGEAWLSRELENLLSRPYAEQRRSPLEIFQEAMAFPTAALSEAGAVPRVRDPVEMSALPGDLFGLAPASSAEMGEDVWRAHLNWGAAKASEVTRLVEPEAKTVAPPRAVLVASNLLDRDRVEGAVRAAGYDFAAWSSVADPLPDRLPDVAFVDLEHHHADDAVRRLARAGVRVVGFGPHVDDVGMLRARRLGAAAALPRSRFFKAIGEFLPPLV